MGIQTFRGPVGLSGIGRLGKPKQKNPPQPKQPVYLHNLLSRHPGAIIIKTACQKHPRSIIAACLLKASQKNEGRNDFATPESNFRTKLVFILFSGLKRVFSFIHGHRHCKNIPWQTDTGNFLRNFFIAIRRQFRGIAGKKTLHNFHGIAIKNLHLILPTLGKPQANANQEKYNMI